MGIASRFSLASLTRAAALAGIAALYLVPLGRFGLAEPDEGRYAEIAREMLLSGDWVTPHLNFVKYFEKPPLVYWLTALSQWVFGPQEFAVRFVPVAAGLLTLTLTYLLARAMFSARHAQLSLAILATAPLFYVMSQVLTLDVPLTASITSALTCFWFGYTRPPHRARWYRAMYVAVAVGVLIKGPVAIVLPGLTVVVFLAARREWRELLGTLRGDGMMLAAAVAAPWFILVSLRNPEFPQFFFVREHLQRYTTTGEHREAFWFYVPVVVGGLAPWTLLALGDPKRWWPPTWRIASAAHQFCLAWVGAMFMFFSLSVSKLGTYALPFFPPLTMLLASVAIDQLDRERPQGLRFAAYGLVVLGAACIIASGVLRWPGLVDPRARPAWLPLLIGGLVMGAAGAHLRHLVRAQRLARALTVFGGATALFLAVAISGRGVVSQYRELSQAIATTARPDDLLVSYGQYVQGLPFYTGKRVAVVRGWGELEFGRTQGDQSAYFWPDDDRLHEAWRSDRRVILVINRIDFDRLRPSLTPAPIEIAQQGKKVAVTNREPR